ncbi:MAG TPA: DinB family protein [Flavobacterium sp.]|nr:DinB family protein [Flavobacterium sp.]
METQRINELFKNLYNGNPWLDVTLVGTLKNLTPAQAAQKKYPGRNSIWEITNHLISWRENVLERIKGADIVTPSHNYFLPVKDTSDAAWEQTLANLNISQQKWTAFLDNMRDAELSGIYPPNGHTHYEHIHGIIQHDAYHLGQIVLLAKHPE